MTDEPEERRAAARVAVVGVGAIGSLFAAQAYACGHRVTLCARAAVEPPVVDGPLGIGRVRASVETDASALEPAEWVFLATKTHDTPTTAPWLAALADAQTTIVVLQNGVDHRERVERLAPGATVLPALVFINVEPRGGRHFSHRAGNLVILPDEPAAAGLGTLLAGRPLEIRRERDFHTVVWRKMLHNLAANAITALTLRRLEVLRDDGIAELARGLIAEGIAVGRAEGAALEEDDVERAMATFGNFPPDAGSSMYWDRLNGRTLEWKHLNGHIARRGRAHGIPTPLHDAIVPLLAAVNWPGDGDPRRRQGAG